MKKLSSLLILIALSVVFLALGCDVTVDEDTDAADYTIAYYRDADGDLYGDATSFVKALTQPDGYINNSLDCDDTDAAINPDATEIAGNAADEDCDGVVAP